MNPKQFVFLAIAAIVSSLLAVVSWTIHDQWSQGSLAGSRLFPSLTTDAAKVAAVEIRQGATTLTLEKKGSAWGVKERAGYPADPEKMRALLVRLAQADLLEAKTRKADRHALLELGDPAGKDAKSRSIKVLDAKGGVLADVVVGKRRADAFGAGKGGTYVRKPGDVQTWLASGEIDAPTGPRDWIKGQAFDTDSGKINKLTVEIDGEEPLKIERGTDKDAKVAFLAWPPEGKKLKDTYAAETILRAAGAIELEDVRQLTAPPAGKDVSKVTFESAGGLAITYRIRKDGDAQWLSITAAGDGETKKQADDVTAKTGGWEYKISPGKMESLLKRRAELLDDKAS